MSGSMTAPNEVGEYLGAVRAALADLPAEERDDLLVEVEASIADAAAESDAPVAARLGPPEEFAAELRAAAGLQVSPPAPADHESLGQILRRIGRHPALRRLPSVARELAPIWWVARGYAAVGIVAVWLGTAWSSRYPFVPRFKDSAGLGVAMIALGVLLSVGVGLALRRRGLRSWLVPLVDLALVAALVAVLVSVDNATVSTPAATVLIQSPPVTGLAYNGVPITNIYPYSRDGRLLHDVLLYDQAGAPLAVAGNRTSDPDRRFLRTRSGRLVLNGFPIRYFQPGTNKVANPNAGPKILVPVVVTKPVTGAQAKRGSG